MVATPGPGSAPAVGQQQSDPLAAKLAALEKKVDNIGRRVPTPLVVGPAGAPYLSIQPSGWFDASGNTIYTLTLRDDQGKIMFSMFPTATSGNVGTNWAYAWQDRGGNQILASDGKAGAGLAYPYISVPMYPQWSGSLSATPAADNSGYSTVLASAIATTKLMWEGRIGFCSHPYISIDGIWGRGSGAGLETITYTLKVGSTIVGTWNATGIVEELVQFNIASFIGGIDLPVQLFALSSLSNTDAIACQVMGAWLRQSP